MSDREFLFNYRFDGAEWGISIFASDPTKAKEKIKAVALARYEGELHMKISAAVPGAGFLTRTICWWNNRRKKWSDDNKQHKVGEYIADYTMPTQSEIHAPIWHTRGRAMKQLQPEETHIERIEKLELEIVRLHGETGHLKVLLQNLLTRPRDTEMRMDPMWSAGWDAGYERGEQMSGAEIERLKAALRKIASMHYDNTPATEAADIARAALEGKK